MNNTWWGNMVVLRVGLKSIELIAPNMTPRLGYLLSALQVHKQRTAGFT